MSSRGLPLERHVERDQARAGLVGGRRGGSRSGAAKSSISTGGGRHDGVARDLGLQLREPLDQALAAGPQRGHQALELTLERVELGEHAVGGLLDARDVVGGLLPGLGAQLGGAALGGLEDQADLLGGAAGERDRAAGATLGLELVGDAPQMLVDGRRVVPRRPVGKSRR